MQVTCGSGSICDFCIPSINRKHGDDGESPPSHGVPTSRDESWVDGSLGWKRGYIDSSKGDVGQAHQN